MRRELSALDESRAWVYLTMNNELRQGPSCPHNKTKQKQDIKK
jgi:hypothetical protein